MGKMTPQEVYKAVAADFKRYGITYEKAAEELGYTNKQTVANILSGKKYMAPEQAKRFHDVFGYDMSTLMSGDGYLVFNPQVRSLVLTKGPDGKETIFTTDDKLTPEGKIGLLEKYLQNVCLLSDDREVQSIWPCYYNMIRDTNGAMLTTGYVHLENLIRRKNMERFGPKDKIFADEEIKK